MRPYLGSSATPWVRKCRRPLPWHHERVLRKLVVLMTLAGVTVGAVGASSGLASASSVTPSGGTTYEGPGTASAEDAVTAYMNAMAAGDLDQMVGTFAVETYVDNFDFDVYLARIRAYSPFVAPLLVPPATPFTRALDVEQRQGAVVGQIARQYLGLAVPDLDLTQTVNLPDDSSVGDLSTALTTAVTDVDLSGVGSFTFVPLADVDAAAATNYASEQNRANLDAYRASVGADEVTDVVVRFEVGGQSFLGFFSALRYGDAWWLDQIGGNFSVLVGVDAFHAGAAPEGVVGTA